MMIVFNSIEAQRRAAGPIVTSLSWLLVPIVALFAYGSSGEFMKVMLVGGLCAALSTVVSAKMVNQRSGVPCRALS